MYNRPAFSFTDLLIWVNMQLYIACLSVCAMWLWAEFICQDKVSVQAFPFFFCQHPCYDIFILLVHRKRRMLALWNHCCESCAGWFTSFSSTYLFQEIQCSGLLHSVHIFQLFSNVPIVLYHMKCRLHTSTFFTWIIEWASCTYKSLFMSTMPTAWS